MGAKKEEYRISSERGNLNKRYRGRWKRNWMKTHGYKVWLEFWCHNLALGINSDIGFGQKIQNRVGERHRICRRL